LALSIHNPEWVEICSGDYCSYCFNENNNLKVGNNSLVEVEIDINKKIVLFYINGMQCPYYVDDVVSSPLLFGVSGRDTQSIVEILLVQKLSNSSIISSLNNNKIKWKMESSDCSDCEDTKSEDEDDYSTRENFFKLKNSENRKINSASSSFISPSDTLFLRNVSLEEEELRSFFESKNYTLQNIKVVPDNSLKI
jgi:hypothetical protein